MIEAYVTNLGRYNEGHLDGEYLKLPASAEDVQALLKRIHVDGARYEEIFITDYETGIDGLRGCLGENESIDELNYLASLLDDMEEWELEKFEAAIAYGDNTGNVKDLINLTQNLDCYQFYPGVTTEEELGYYLIDELGALEIPEDLQGYFDYEAYGRDAVLNGGTLTDNGYIENNGAGFTEYYGGRDDIPDEYRIFSYPVPEKASIRETLKAYQKMIAEAPALSGEKHRPAATHDDR